MRLDLFMKHHPNVQRPKRNGMEGEAKAHANPEGKIDKPQFLGKSVDWANRRDHAPSRKARDA
jgi:hypothetical protein